MMLTMFNQSNHGFHNQWLLVSGRRLVSVVGVVLGVVDGMSPCLLMLPNLAMRLRILMMLVFLHILTK